MNEFRTGSTIGKALDESTDRLPWRVTHRLEAARRQALERFPDARPTAGAAATPAHPGAIIATGAGIGVLGTGSWPTDRNLSGSQGAGLIAERPSFGWRAALIGATLAALVAGLLGVAQLESARAAAELDELESALLDDQVPIAGFADRGFGAFLRGVSPSGR
jgi:hypothetical protein